MSTWLKSVILRPMNMYLLKWKLKPLPKLPPYWWKSKWCTGKIRLTRDGNLHRIVQEWYQKWHHWRQRLCWSVLTSKRLKALWLTMRALCELGVKFRQVYPFGNKTWKCTMLQKLSKCEVKVHNSRMYLPLNFAWNQFW